jgi:hypothetical protein
MPKTHPHAEATYRVIAFEDGSFAVEVAIPDTNPTTVRPFKTSADAEAWITEHQRRVTTQSQPGWFRERRTPRMGNPNR